MAQKVDKCVVVPAANVNKQAPAHKKVALKSNRKKKKCKSRKAKVEDSISELKKVVSVLKRPKDVVSGNWQAFLTSNFIKEEKAATKPKSIKLNPGSPRRTRVPKLFKASSVGQGDTTPTPSVNTVPQDDNSEDAYLVELDPKSDKQRHDLTRCIAMDCEMVGVFDGKESVLARVSLVNQHGECVYDKFVKPKEKVADYRTKVSGVRPSDLKRGEDFETVQKEVAAMLAGRILVGHALRNDMRVLLLNHPPKMVRDTSRFKPFRNVTNGRTPSLKKLSSEILGVTIQSGEHSSIEDAKAAMQLYNLYQKEWEDHRLQKKALRRRNAIAAATGISKVPPKKKNSKKPSTNTLLDEFAAY